EHEKQLQDALAEAGEGASVLYPSPDAVLASDLANLQPHGHGDLWERFRSALCACGSGRDASTVTRQRCVVVLDGGWKETRKMNQSIDGTVTRCSVRSATRDEYGGTRKYKGNARDDVGRVQTAAAFIAFLKELGEDPEGAASLSEGLTRYTEKFDRPACLCYFYCCVVVVVMFSSWLLY
ncbi:unnamed protein product, partial [Polarella glacialis]